MPSSKTGLPVCWGFSGKYHKYGPQSGQAPALQTGQTFTQISSGIFHTCALRMDGSPLCCGLRKIRTDLPHRQSEIFTEISSSQSHTCALKPDGTPVCWAEHEHGQSDRRHQVRLSPQSRVAASTTALSDRDGYTHMLGSRTRTSRLWNNGQAVPPPTHETFVSHQQPAQSHSMRPEAGRNTRSAGEMMSKGKPKYQPRNP